MVDRIAAMWRSASRLPLLWWIAAILLVMTVTAFVLVDLASGDYYRAALIVALNIFMGWVGWTIGMKR